MAGALLVVVFLLVGLAVPLLLYLLIEGETKATQTLDRSDAERVARERSAERYRSDDRETGGPDDAREGP